MTNKQNILALFQDDTKERAAKIKAFITDKANSYEDRLEVWLGTPDHLRSKGQWILHLDEFNKKYGEISWFDDFFCERYTEVDLRECYRQLIEDDSMSEEEALAKALDFATECMDKGFHSFCLDW